MPPSSELGRPFSERAVHEAVQRPAAHEAEPPVIGEHREAALKQLHGPGAFETFQRQLELDYRYRRIANEAEKALPLLERLDNPEGPAWAGTLRSAIKELKGESAYTLGAVSARATIDAGTAIARSRLATTVSNLKGLFEQLAKADGHPSPDLLRAIGELMDSRNGLSATLNELGTGRADSDDFSFATFATEGLQRPRHHVDPTALEGASSEYQQIPYRRVADDFGPGSGI